ncbi:ferredoxin--NADP reductase [Spirochaeta africana]|uniref:Flavodoxin reductase family protein n=1 Tax=Spirochaeta africana (strain ATCC 700263 / DSM 8902 / Z-7692) TaxID=889378 RepID=H9UJV9_SPIAZ|nr:FAD-binding oxidoreductase [Spirochaeta africana]AFG37802.1 flavodoxin reductase family protein [Spirochaeta africana DSM 8902]
MPQSAAAAGTAVSAFSVHHVRHLSPTAFVVRFDRNRMQFAPGQYITVGIAGDLHVREYSIYSSPDDDFLEILVKSVEGGLVSHKLQQLEQGDSLQVEGPFGYFVLDEHSTLTRQSEVSSAAPAPVLMIATGTGISPFHSMVSTNPEMPYTLLHGVRSAIEDYDWQRYTPGQLVRCITRDTDGTADFAGRVTDYLRQNPVTDPSTRCMLCGNCDMIYEVFDILQEQGIPSQQLYAEVYF